MATSAFGVGVDKSYIKHIVSYGVPDNIRNWAQELERAGRKLMVKELEQVFCIAFPTLTMLVHGLGIMYITLSMSNVC